MKTKEQILEESFSRRGIRKGWLKDSKLAVLEAMEEYAEIKMKSLKSDSK